MRASMKVKLGMIVNQAPNPPVGGRDYVKNPVAPKVRLHSKESPTSWSSERTTFGIGINSE